MAADSFETWIIQGRINLHRSWKEAGCRGVGWSGVEGHPHSALTITFPGCLSPYSPAVTLFFFFTMDMSNSCFTFFPKVYVLQ